MTIRYELVPDNDPGDVYDYRLDVVPGGVWDLDMLVAEVIDDFPGAAHDDLRTRFKNDLDECLARASVGQRAKLGDLLRLLPKARRPDGTYEIDFVPGVRLQQVMQKAQLEPYPVLYSEPQTHSINQRLVPAGIGGLKGCNLHFDPERPDEGVFLIDRGSGEELRVKDVGQSPSDALDDPDELTMITPPALQPGTYLLEVRARVRGRQRDRQRDRPELRTGRLARVLAVHALRIKR